ncbi:hypothetical protein CVT91_00760 [Candidatus Atribacteria bacterium HGW-Atribacteria-1]|nr:MAG: hypothetical protein CVT91_00760 [Candidatus Atribacteria bacterium HGW-Atribacteria-1]
MLKQSKKFKRYKIFSSLRFKASGSSGFAFYLVLNAGRQKEDCPPFQKYFLKYLLQLGMGWGKIGF